MTAADRAGRDGQGTVVPIVKHYPEYRIFVRYGSPGGSAGGGGSPGGGGSAGGGGSPASGVPFSEQLSLSQRQTDADRDAAPRHALDVWMRDDDRGKCASYSTFTKYSC